MAERWGGLMAELDRRYGRPLDYIMVRWVPTPKGTALLLEPIPPGHWPNTLAANDP